MDQKNENSQLPIKNIFYLRWIFSKQQEKYLMKKIKPYFTNIGWIVKEIKKMDKATERKAVLDLKQVLAEIWLKNKIKTRMLEGTHQKQKIEEYKAREEIILSVKNLLTNKLQKIMEDIRNTK